MEDEIVYCTNIKNIKNFFKSKSNSNFKKEFLNSNNILQKLEQFNFDILKLWSRVGVNYKQYKNNSIKIKKMKK